MVHGLVQDRLLPWIIGQHGVRRPDRRIEQPAEDDDLVGRAEIVLGEVQDVGPERGRRRWRMQ